MDIKTLGDLFNKESNNFFAPDEFTRIVKNSTQQLCSALSLPKLTNDKIRRTTLHLTDTVAQIPQEIKNIMLNGDTDYKENEILAFTESYTDGSVEVHYGRYHKNKNTLDTLRVDSSGYYEPVGEPYDTTDWEIHKEFSKTAIQKVRNFNKQRWCAPRRVPPRPTPSRATYRCRFFAPPSWAAAPQLGALSHPTSHFTP